MNNINDINDTALSVRIWGSRGSCAAPFSDRMVYGGNTSCVSLHWEEGTVIFDAGTGILALGQWLEEMEKEKQKPIYLFISHLHLDHVIGLPLFPLFFEQGIRFHLYGSGEGEKTFQERLTTLLSPPYWPVSIREFPASITWHEGKKGDVWELPGGVKVRAMRANHPNDCLIYRLERGGVSVVYGLDCEFSELEGADSGELNRKEPRDGVVCGGESVWEAYKSFARKCSLLIFDAPYTREEYPCYRGFGHSYWEKGVQMAKECQAERLFISHHNWSRSDEELVRMEEELCNQAQKAGIGAEMAKEGREIRISSLSC